MSSCNGLKRHSTGATHFGILEFGLVFFYAFLINSLPSPSPVESVFICGCLKLGLHVACFFFFFLLPFCIHFPPFKGQLLHFWHFWAFLYAVDVCGSFSSLDGREEGAPVAVCLNLLKKTPSFSCFWISVSKIKVSQISVACWHIYVH